jgi:hypothetical protein
LTGFPERSKVVLPQPDAPNGAMNFRQGRS